MPSLQQTFWKIWYQYISKRIGNDPVNFLNYGYMPPEGNTIELHSDDEMNRPAIQLYHHVASGAELKNKNVLEVSCGHGGGASFIKRYHQPKTYTGIDQNPKAIERNQKNYKHLDIDFRVDDAQNLHFPENTFDAVINIEASHCYPRQDSFFKSAYRVLRQNGHLLYADFRTPTDTIQLEKDMSDAGFQIKSKTNITPHVVRALQTTSERYRNLVHKLAPKFLHNSMEMFAAVEGTKIYNYFVNGERIYWNYQLLKTT